MQCLLPDEILIFSSTCDSNHFQRIIWNCANWNDFKLNCTLPIETILNCCAHEGASLRLANQVMSSRLDIPLHYSIKTCLFSEKQFESVELWRRSIASGGHYSSARLKFLVSPDVMLHLFEQHFHQIHLNSVDLRTSGKWKKKKIK